MKLFQDQIWKKEGIYYKITDWGRLHIEYIQFTDMENRKGEPTTIPKKQFCRMIKEAELIHPKPQ